MQLNTNNTQYILNILSTFIDLSNAYWLYCQCTRHINLRKVFGGVRKVKENNQQFDVFIVWSVAYK